MKIRKIIYFIAFLLIFLAGIYVLSNSSIWAINLLNNTFDTKTGLTAKDTLKYCIDHYKIIGEILCAFGGIGVFLSLFFKNE